MYNSNSEEGINVIDDSKMIFNNSEIRSRVADLEFKTYKILQNLENIKTVPGSTFHVDATSRSKLSPKHIGTNLCESNQLENLFPLLENGTIPSEILKSLECLISEAHIDDEIEFPLPILDDVSYFSLISHSIAAYIAHIDRQRLERIIDCIATASTSWLNQLFNFGDAESSFHHSNADANAQAMRLAIQSQLSKSKGNVISSQFQHKFYISESNSFNRKYVCQQLNIPLDAIRIIPTNSISNGIDLVILENQIKIDLAAQYTPLMIIADIGNSTYGLVDDLSVLKCICKAYNMWLHGIGHGLAASIYCKGLTALNSVVDSIVLYLANWLRLPGIPSVLLSRKVDEAVIKDMESNETLLQRLKCLPIWTSFQTLGKAEINERIHTSLQMCNDIYDIVSKCESIRIISPFEQSRPDRSSKHLNIKTLFNKTLTVIVLQFDGRTNAKNAVTGNTDAEENDKNGTSFQKENNALYYDRLNSWLGQILKRDFPNFNFQIVEHATDGTCIRYCPLESHFGEITEEDKHNFKTNFESHIDILKATVKHKAKFMQLVEKNRVLHFINLPDWAGIGGVRFIPDGWETLLTDQSKAELNKLNTDLVTALKTTDNAFSLGEGADGLSCVCFGMVTHDTDMEELLDLVINVGMNVLDNSRALDTMSEIVIKGIETATSDLKRESEEKLWQEGFIRHVPVLNKVLNWWLPPVKETGIKGRSLNLAQGIVESTENIYKYHMQMLGTTNRLPSNKIPPTPIVQTTLNLEKQ